MTENTTERAIMLDSATVRKFVQKEGYFFPSNPYISRCIDGRYPSGDRLPALAIPGADIGQIVMLFAAANRAHIELDLDDAVNALIDVVGGVENLRIHTDTHKLDGGIAAGCGYFAEVQVSPANFGVTKEQVYAIGRKFEQLISEGAEEAILIGDHEEKGVLIVNGGKAVFPNGRFFVFHQTLAAERNREIVERLFPDKQIKRHAMTTELEGTKGIFFEHVFKIRDILAEDAPVFRVTFRGNNPVTVTPLNHIDV
jgi:hypothetical protein